MPKSSLPAEAVIADSLAAIHKASDALFRHTTKAKTIDNTINRTTVMGPASGTDALPTKGEVSTLVQNMPGCADDDYDDAADAKEARGKIIKSVGSFIKTAVKKSAGKIAEALDESALAPLAKLHSNNLLSIEAIKANLIALQSAIDDMQGAMTGATRKACILRFDSQIKGVIGDYEKINKLNEIVKKLDAEAAAYVDVDAAENIDHEELEKVQDRRANIDKEIERCAASILSVLNAQAATTHGPSTKEERYARFKPMTIPSPLEGKGAELQDIVLAYTIGRGSVMTTLIPAITRMINDYNPDTGLWWSWSDLSDKDDKYLSVPECFRPLMKEQNGQLYADLKTAMAKTTAHKAMWSHINAVHSLGREPKQYSVTEGDGLGLFWMMTMLYRPSDETYRENLEQGTYALCRKLSLQSKGNPTKFVEELRAQLLDANALGVKLKWILTGKMVVTNMANRSNILAQKLQSYLDGSAAVERDDCSADIAHVCALVEEGLAALEATGGDANRAFNTNSDSNKGQREPCKFGDDCYARDCKWGHSKSHNPTAAWKREENRRSKGGGKGGKSGGKGSGKGGQGKQRCQQPGCNEHQKQAYCNAHYRKLQEKQTAKLSRKDKRAANAEVKAEAVRAAKLQKAENLQDLLLQARESGKQSALRAVKKRSRVDSDDDGEHNVFDRMKSSKGAPKSVKAARRKKQAMCIEDLFSSDEDVE